MYLSISIGLILMLVLGYFLRFLLERSFFGKIYYVIVLPGVVVHEISHVFACLITGAKIRSVKLFTKSGGQVIHSAPRLGYVGQFLISMAPIFGCTILLYLLAKKYAPGFINIPPLQTNFATDFFHNFLPMFWHNFKTLDFGNLRTYLFLYLALAFAFGLTPSKEDFKNTLWSILAIILLFILIAQIINFESILPILAKIRAFYLFGDAMLILSIIVSGFFYLLTTIKRIFI